MKIVKKTLTSGSIPQASLPDIIFLLLIFFMVTTVLKQFHGLPVRLPEAVKIEKIESRRHIAYIWISNDGVISIDDMIMDKLDKVTSVMYERRMADPQIIVSLRIDRDADMGLVNDVQDALRKADALRINYTSLPKST